MLNKRFMIEVTAGGVLTFRDKLDPRLPPRRRMRRGERETLPIFSVDTEDEAKFIQITFCRCAHEKDERGGDIYVLNEIGTRALAGEPAELSASELPGFAARFQAALERREENLRVTEELEQR